MSHRTLLFFFPLIWLMQCYLENQVEDCNGFTDGKGGSQQFFHMSLHQAFGLNYRWLTGLAFQLSHTWVRDFPAWRLSFHMVLFHCVLVKAKWLNTDKVLRRHLACSSYTNRSHCKFAVRLDWQNVCKAPDEKSCSINCCFYQNYKQWLMRYFTEYWRA